LVSEALKFPNTLTTEKPFGLPLPETLNHYIASRQSNISIELFGESIGTKTPTN